MELSPMTKPDDIPQDVWDAATSGRSKAILSITNWVIGGMAGPDEPHNHALDMIFARAIMDARAEEREACALIAADYHDHPSELAAFVGEEIADAIRERGEA